MKLVVLLFSLVNGGFMLIDGLFVMVNGKYIGPEKPGPWASVFSPLGVDVFRLGPMFVLFGVVWLVFLYSVYAGQSWAYGFGIGLSILTLWYLPFGTLIALTVLVSLLFFRERVLGN